MNGRNLPPHQSGTIITTFQYHYKKSEPIQGLLVLQPRSELWCKYEFFLIFLIFKSNVAPIVPR